MATSRFEIPESATPDEAAAIAAAVGAHLRDRRTVAVAAAATEADDEGLSPWGLAGRREALTGDPGRPPAGAPSDRWTTLTRLTQR